MPHFHATFWKNDLLHDKRKPVLSQWNWWWLRHCEQVRHPRCWQRPWCYQDDHEVVGPLDLIEDCRQHPEWWEGVHCSHPWPQDQHRIDVLGRQVREWWCIDGQLLVRKSGEKIEHQCPHLENTRSRSRRLIAYSVARVCPTRDRASAWTLRDPGRYTGTSSTSGLELPVWLAGKTKSCLPVWCTQPPWSCHTSDAPHCGGGMDRSLWHRRRLLPALTH